MRLMDCFGTRDTESIETRSAAESVIERVYLAVQQLCVGSGDVRSRLQTAVITLLPLQSREFPSELQQEFNSIIADATKYKSEMPEFRGDLEATMRRIRNSTGQKIAERIFGLYAWLQEIRGFPLLGFRHPEA